jgi:putative hydrolase of the HAD superfamily
MAPPLPALLTFDVFGTVLDWRRGHVEAVARAGGLLSAPAFDRVMDRQGEIEQEAPAPLYRDVVARSLVDVLGLAPEAARAIGAGAGAWPLYPDSAAALRRLQAVAPCAAMTNSDRSHGEEVQRQLGFRLSHWICAEELGLYKPDPRFWQEVARRLGVAPGPAWWHVSAYADYDLGSARSLGLTTVYVERPHARPGAADLAVRDLGQLADRIEALAGPR